MDDTENRKINMLPTGGYLLANGVSREEADKMRLIYKSVVISRNTNGTYRVTRSGH